MLGETGRSSGPSLSSWSGPSTTATAGSRSRSSNRAPGSVALEVGTVNNYNTLHHLRWRGGLARWPYDCPYITILLADGELEEIDGDDPSGRGPTIWPKRSPARNNPDLGDP